ncbi:hypothetical protein LRAMOSA07563 [Lichtheimia ramosa]|uniref:Uncharacterized protein n=1 Tax=Lichtheimia ramosa TaxID=688394 RepID=A0A077WD22_9FUNG|nr:hypothetical protein LRAMOSA07563 [Lichtheimia ramosa]
MNGQRVFVLGTQQCRRLLSTSTIRYSLGKPNALEGAAGTRKKIGKTDWSRPQQQQGSKRNKVPAKRDWSRPTDMEPKQSSQQQQQQQQQRSREQRRERNKKRDEEVALFMKQQEAEMQKLKSKQKAKAQEEKQVQDVYIPHVINAANLSRLLGVRLEHLIRTMEELEMDNVSHDRMLSADESSLIAMQLDMNPIVDERQALDLYPRQVE